MSEDSQKIPLPEEDIKNPFITVEKIKPDLRKKELPMVDVKVTNPITYIKSWWKRVIGNEGIEIRLRIKPLTAIIMTAIIVSLYLGIGKIVLPFKIPFFELNPKSTPVPEQFRETAFAGTLRYTESSNKYFLETSASEAINLEIPENIDLEKFIGRRVFATGEYGDDSRILKVSDVSDLEIFPEEIIPIPTMKPFPSTIATTEPSQSPTSTPIPEGTPEPNVTETPIATSTPSSEP